MFKSRNRSVRKKIELPSSTTFYPSALNCFGEIVENKSSTSSNKLFDGENLKNISNDVHSFDESSSSSVSWGEEYEVEATRRVQEHFNRMERILRGLQAIPDNYDVHEYKLWLKTFPNLSITGQKIKQPAKQSGRHLNYREEIIAIDYPNNKNGCDISASTSKNKEKLKCEIKSAVSDIIFENVSASLYPDRTAGKYQEKRQDSRHHKNINNVEEDFEDILQISPVLLNRNKRNRSSHSISRSHVLSSKWLRDNSPEFTSLPFLATERTVTVKNESSASAKIKDVQLCPQTKHKNFTLPPININNNNKISLLGNKNYRSISATPQKKSNKTMSAISVQVDSLLAKNSRLNVNGCYYLAENEQYLKTPVKYPRTLNKLLKR